MAVSEHEEEVNLLQNITKEVAATTDLSAALELVLRRVCEKTGWALAQAWLPNKEGMLLECGPVWFCDGVELKPFREASMQSQFPPGVGLPGRVWQSKKPCWIEDIRQHLNFPRIEAANEVG